MSSALKFMSVDLWWTGIWIEAVNSLTNIKGYAFAGGRLPIPTFVEKVEAVAVGPDEEPDIVVRPPSQEPSDFLKSVYDDVVDVVVLTPPESVALSVVIPPDHIVDAGVMRPMS